jgi:hypothetical protein
MFDRLRKSFDRLLDSTRTEAASQGEKRAHNLFEAAAAYISACADDDQDRIDETVTSLSFGVSELACRAVIALARERDESPQTVARSLLGLPAA